MGHIGFIYINSINPNKKIYLRQVFLLFMLKVFSYLCTVNVNLPKVTQLVGYTVFEPGQCGSRGFTVV